MSDYTKTTDFAAKDALLTGNPSKVVLGSEIDAEFEALETAVNSKLDDVLTTRGDILVEGASGETRLAIGSAGYILRSDGTDPAWHLPVYGGRAYRATAGNLAAGAGWDYYVYFDSEIYDNASCLSLVSPAGGNMTLITVPSGMTWMRVESVIAFEADSSGRRGIGVFSTNAAGSTETSLTPVCQTLIQATSSGTTVMNFSTGWLPVTAGTYYKIGAYNGSSSALDFTNSWLAVEFK